MAINYNVNIHLLMGGSYEGRQNWTKPSDDIDKCFKVYLFKKGESILYSCGNQYILNSDNVYFINGFEISGQRCQEYMSVDWLHFIPESVYLDHILKTFSCVNSFDVQQLAPFIQTFNTFREYFAEELSESDRTILSIEIQSLVQYLIAQVVRRYGHEIIENDYNFKRLLPAREFINHNYRSGISLDKLAETCCLSPNYFNRLFSQTFRITPLNYIQERRLADASRMLLYSSKQIKEIAYETGYGDAAYFSRVFSKVFHESPRSFRMNKKRSLP